MSQSQKPFGVGLSGIIGLALDADLSRSEIADELRRAAELLCPSQRVRFAMAEGERMSIDPTLDEPMPMPDAQSEGLLPSVAAGDRCTASIE
jgi:hypothetical protein